MSGPSALISASTTKVPGSCAMEPDRVSTIERSHRLGWVVVAVALAISACAGPRQIAIPSRDATATARAAAARAEFLATLDAILHGPTRTPTVTMTCAGPRQTPIPSFHATATARAAAARAEFLATLDAILHGPTRTSTVTMTPYPSRTPLPSPTPFPEALHDPNMPVPPSSLVAWYDGKFVWAVRDSRTMQIAEVGEASCRLWPSSSARRLAYVCDYGAGWTLWFAKLDADPATEPAKMLEEQALSHLRPVPPYAPPEAGVWPCYIAWSPDDRGIVFTLADVWEAEHGGFAKSDDLWWLDDSGSPPRQLLAPGQGGPAVFSPDGAWLAFTHIVKHRTGSREYWRSVVAAFDPVSAIAGTATPVQLLEAPPFSSQSEWTVYHGLRWDQSSQYLYVAVGRENEDLDGWAALDGPVDLVRVGLDGSRETVRSSRPLYVPWQQFPNVRWSPDLSRIVAPYEPATRLPDPGPDSTTELGPTAVLVAQALSLERWYPSDPQNPNAPAVARLVLVAADGHWREIAPRALIWAKAPPPGVLGE